MEQDRAKAEAGWGTPGMPDTRSLMPDARSMMDAMQDSNLLSAMAAHRAQNGQMSQANVPQSFGPAGNMAAGGMIGAGGLGVPAVDLPFMYPSPDNQGGEFKKGGFAEPTNPSDAQLNLKRRISQLVQMRALQQQALFGPAGGSSPGLENNPQMFRAQALQAPRGDNCGGTSSPIEMKSEGGLWKLNAQKDVQFGPTSPRGGMMMPASPSPRPLSRPQSRPPSRNDGPSPLGFFPNPESPHLHQQQFQQQQQQQQQQHIQQQQQHQKQQIQQQQQNQQQQNQQQQHQQIQQQQQIHSQLKQNNSQQFQVQHALQHPQNSLQQFQHQQQYQQPNSPQQQQSSHPLQHKHPMFGNQDQNIHQTNIHHQMQQQLQQQQQQSNNLSPGNQQRQQSPHTQSNTQQLQNSQRLSNTPDLNLQGHQHKQQFINPQFSQAQGVQQDKQGSPHIDVQHLMKGQQFHNHLQGNNHLNHFEMPNPNQGQPVNKLPQENLPHLNALQHMQQQHQQKMQQQQSMQQQPPMQKQPHQQQQQILQQQQQKMQQQHRQQSLHNQQHQQQNSHQLSLHQQQVQQQYHQPQPDRQQQQQHLPTSQPQDPFKKPSSQAPFWNPSQGSHDKVNAKSFPSLGSFVTTASAAVPLMSPVNGAPRTQMLDAMSGRLPKSAQQPCPQLPGMPMNMQQFDQQFPQFRTDGIPSSLGCNSVSNEGKKIPSNDQKSVNGDKPKKIRKPKPKVEKAPNSKISDLMASDIDRKLLAIFPKYQFYLDQNTKPDEDLMPAPGVKKAKKKRPANITPEGEPKKKKKIKKKVEGESQGVVSPSSPAVSKSPLLASEAAPMDTDLSRQQLEDRTVAQILAAIKEPKSAAPVAGLPPASHSLVSANNSSVQVGNHIQSAVGQEAVKADPFDFLDDDVGSAVKPLFTKKISLQDPKESAHGPTSDQPHDEVKGDKYCCNHCEVVGEVQSLQCQNKHSHSSSLPSNPPGDPSPMQGQQMPQDQSSTSPNSTCLSSSSVQTSSAESTTVTASSANTFVPTVTSGLSTGPVTSINESQPKDYIRDQGPQNQANPLANLQASVQSIFNYSLQNNNENHPPRPQIPPEMLKEYLDKAEGNNMSKMSAPLNGILSAKTAEFLSKNYSPPHDIKPVPPSVPSALNQSEGKTEMKPPMFSPGGPSGPEQTPQTTPTQDRSKSFNLEDEELLVDDLPIKPGSAEEELSDRLKNNKVEVPHCDCLGPNSIPNEGVEGPYYTQLGSGPDLPSIRRMMEDRLGVTGKAIRMEKIVYSGKEGKSTQGCPIAKWIIRRSGPEEKYLCISRYRPGHFCANAFIVTNLVAWEGVPSDMADDLYSYLRSTVTKLGFETERRCGTNERKTCACQGVDLIRRGASFSFGCSWSMYFNGCKYARSRDAKKFKLKDTSKEPELESKLQDLATKVGPLYETMAPDAHRNQCNFEVEGGECRLGQNKDRPFSGVTACVDFCAHAHKDLHNMNNGSTVVVTLTKHRGFEKPDDEQLHVLPLYVLDRTDEFGSEEGQREKIRNGSLEVLANFPLEARMRAQPLTPKKRVKGGKKESPGAKKKREAAELIAQAQQAAINNQQLGASPVKEQKAMFENLMKQDNNESLSFEDLMTHQNLPGFNELYGKFWDYFYANGTFPPGSFVAKWASNKMSVIKNQNMNNVKMENNKLNHHHPNHPNQPPNGPHSNLPPNDPHQNQSQNGLPNGPQMMNQPPNGQHPNQPPNGPHLNQPTHGPHMTQHTNGPHMNQPPNGQHPNQPSNSPHPNQPSNSPHPNQPPHPLNSQHLHQPNGVLPECKGQPVPNNFTSPLDLLTAAAMMQNGPGPHNPSAPSTLPVPSQPGPGPMLGPHSGPFTQQRPTLGPNSGPFNQQGQGPMGPFPQSGPPSGSFHPAQDKPHPSEQQAMQTSSQPNSQETHSKEGQIFTNPQGLSNRAACDPAGNFMCNGLDKMNCDSRQQNEAEPTESLIDPTVVKCEWQYNEEMFSDPTIGGVAIALSHGAVLFEVAKRELHATTALKNPNRYQPTRISLVFYQHKNLNYRHHGWYENERKMEMLRQKKLEKMKAESESEMEPPSSQTNGEPKTMKKKKKKEIDFSKTSAAQYKYMWEAPVRHGISLTTDSIITRWIDPQPMVTGPYQRWV